MEKRYSHLFSIAYTVYCDEPQADALTREQHVTAMLRRVADINEDVYAWHEAMGAPLETNEIDAVDYAAHVAAKLVEHETRIAEKNSRIEMLERDLQERGQRLKDYDGRLCQMQLEMDRANREIDELRKTGVLQKHEIERLIALDEAQRRLDDLMDVEKQKQAKPTG